MIILLYIISFLLCSTSYAMNTSQKNPTEPSWQIQLCLLGINNNNVFSIKSGLCAGADVNYCNENGKSLFYLASQQKDNTSIIKEIISHKDIDATVFDINNRTPLHKAYELGLSDIAKNMHNKKPRFICDLKGNSHLHTAVINGQISCIKELLPYDKDILNYPNFDGNTPLHLAALYKQLNIIDFLIQNDANPTIKNNQQQTPLATLFFTGEMINFMQNYAEPYLTMLLQTDKNKNNQFHLYATTLFDRKIEKKEFLKYLKLLIQIYRMDNSNIHERNNKGKTAIDIACETYNQLYQQYILTKNADFYKIVCGQEFIMHIFLCAFSPHTECVLFLEMIKGFHPAIQQLIMYFYYLLNIETIMAKTYISSDTYYDRYIEIKDHFKKTFIKKPKPKLLWNVV